MTGVSSPEDEFVFGLARSSPAGFAAVAYRWWNLAEHHRLLNDAIMAAVARPDGRLIVSLPVRSGKTWLTSRVLPAWFLGLRPDSEVILACAEADFAADHGRVARDLMSGFGERFFGVSVDPANSAKDHWGILGHRGGMKCFGTTSAVLGRGADLLLIDDPHGSHRDAMSETSRNEVNQWVAGSMMTRLEPGGTIIVISSRWHEDDITGTLLREQPGVWTELKIPALCVDPDGDLLGRQVGESYWPERWPVELLERRRAEEGEIVWAAQHQQNPVRPEGGLFPVSQFRIIDSVPDASSIDWCRGWDLAGTRDGGDYTVGVKLGRDNSTGRLIIADIVRGQHDVATVRETIKTTAALDGKPVLIDIPKEPGQAGIFQAQQIIGTLAGFRAYATVQTGSKETRALGFAAQVQIGNVDLVRAPWNTAFINEARAFSTGRYDDQIDAVCAAFNRLLATPACPPSGIFRVSGYRDDDPTRRGPSDASYGTGSIYGTRLDETGGNGTIWTPSPYS